MAMETTADIAARVLLPHAGDLEAIVLGGDRHALAEVLQDGRLRPLARLAEDRVLDVPDPRQRVLADLPDRFRAVVLRPSAGTDVSVAGTL
jgi:hypothetical protein